jgi:hypothetical protein
MKTRKFLAAFTTGKDNMQMKMNTKHWWYDIDGGKLKYSESNVSWCHFAHLVSRMD